MRCGVAAQHQRVRVSMSARWGSACRQSWALASSDESPAGWHPRSWGCNQPGAPLSSSEARARDAIRSPPVGKKRRGKNPKLDKKLPLEVSFLRKATLANTHAPRQRSPARQHAPQAAIERAVSHRSWREHTYWKLGRAYSTRQVRKKICGFLTKPTVHLRRLRCRLHDTGQHSWHG